MGQRNAHSKPWPEHQTKRDFSQKNSNRRGIFFFWVEELSTQSTRTDRVCLLGKSNSKTLANRKCRGKRAPTTSAQQNIPTASERRETPRELSRTFGTFGGGGTGEPDRGRGRTWERSGGSGGSGGGIVAAARTAGHRRSRELHGGCHPLPHQSSSFHHMF